MLLLWLAVGEDQEVSIKEVADAIVKAVGCTGEYTVWSFICQLTTQFTQEYLVRYHPFGWAVPQARFQR